MAVRALPVHEPRRAHLGKITGAAKEPEYMLQWGCTSLHVTHTTLAKYMCEDDSSSSRRHKNHTLIQLLVHTVSQCQH